MIDVDVGGWTSESLTYGSTNDSEREVFLTAALCNDEVGYQQYAGGAGCFAPEVGLTALQIRSQSRSAFHRHVHRTKGSREGATHFFELLRREISLVERGTRVSGG